MGYNTTVVVLNDALGDIENDPNFGKKLAQAIKQISFRQRHIDVPAGSYVNAACVIETHHASSNAVVAVGGNFGSVLGEVATIASHHEEAGQIAILVELAEKFGYKLSKIPNRIREERSN